MILLIIIECIDNNIIENFGNNAERAPAAQAAAQTDNSNCIKTGTTNELILDAIDYINQDNINIKCLNQKIGSILKIIDTNRSNPKYNILRNYSIDKNKNGMISILRGELSIPQLITPTSYERTDNINTEIFDPQRKLSRSNIDDLRNSKIICSTGGYLLPNGNTIFKGLKGFLKQKGSGYMCEVLDTNTNTNTNQNIIIGDIKNIHPNINYVPIKPFEIKKFTTEADFCNYYTTNGRPNNSVPSGQGFVYSMNCENPKQNYNWQNNMSYAPLDQFVPPPSN